MTKSKALKVFNSEYRLDPKKGAMLAREFIEKIYKEGHCILSADEKEKVRGMTIVAQIHNQNPFEKK